MPATILIGDVRVMLATLPDASVHCCVTSPPFWGLRTYQTEPQIWGGNGCAHVWADPLPHGRRGNRGISGAGGNLNPALDTAGQGPGAGNGGAHCQSCGAWKGELGTEPTVALYIEHLVEIFRAVRRVLHNDGTLWLNIGDCYAGNGCGARDAERWPKQSRNDHSLPGHRRSPEMKEKDLALVPARVALALQEDGWYVRSDIVWSKKNPMPESTQDRPTRSHEYLFLLTKKPRYYYDAFAIREKGVSPAGTRAAKGSAERSAMPGVNSRPPEYKVYDGTRNKRSVWTVNTRGYPGAHFATFPPALVTPCILAGTSQAGCCPVCLAPWKRVTERQPTGATQKMADGWDTGPGAHGTVHRQGREKGEGGVPITVAVTTGWQATCKHNEQPIACCVLDPFGGSGTTAAVALEHGRDCILIELQPDYLPLMEARLAKVQPRLPETCP